MEDESTRTGRLGIHGWTVDYRGSNNYVLVLEGQTAMMTTPPPDTKVQSETPEQIAERIVNASWWGIPAEATRQKLKADILFALRNRETQEPGLMLTEREKQILIDHHNYEAEKAITRTGCRETERFHRDRVRAIRKGR